VESHPSNRSERWWARTYQAVTVHFNWYLYLSLYGLNEPDRSSSHESSCWPGKLFAPRTLGRSGALLNNQSALRYQGDGNLHCWTPSSASAAIAMYRQPKLRGIRSVRMTA